MLAILSASTVYYKMYIFYQILLSLLVILIGISLFTGSCRRRLHIIYKTLPRDLLGAYRFMRVNVVLWWWERQKYTVPKIFTKLADTRSKEIAFICEDKEWTYQQLDEFSTRIGCYIQTQKLLRGDSIALLMEGQVEYIGIWLGLSKVGLITALINTNLRQDVLVHSIKAADCKALIFSSELQTAVEEIRNKIPNLHLYQYSTHSEATVLEGAIDLNLAIESITPNRLVKDISIGNPKDKLIYIYTSGTTGVPKAAVISNLRYMLITYGVYEMLNLKKTDRLYNTLPLYHTAGGVIGVGQSLLNGVTVVLRKHFSASKFWSDCVRYECTAAQYIGEMCRYILAVPPSPFDTAHKVRLMLGNGLRPQIWESFVERFRVKQIGEFYGSSEGNANLVNIDNKMGAVGFVTHFASSLYTVALLKVDEETGNPLRGPDGFCIPCKVGEPGIFVGKINSKKATNDFAGYADRQATQRKIINNVFRKGDKCFNSGDILVMDEYRYFYFKDRTGDTFRWRGENVSTAEVEAVISNIIGLKDVVVYGVEIPNIEGRAGMAAIYSSEQMINLNNLAKGITIALPSYARPLFIRVLSKLSITGTFKLKKGTLQEEGFNINKIQDSLYFLERTGKYVPLTEDMYTDILGGKMRI